MRIEETLRHVAAVHVRAQRALRARAEMARVHPHVVARAPGVEARCITQQEGFRHHERVVTLEPRLGCVFEPAGGLRLRDPQLRRADGLDAVPVGEVPVQVRHVHIHDLDARVVDLEVRLELRRDVDDHLKAAVEYNLEASVVLCHRPLEVSVALFATLEVEERRDPNNLVRDALVRTLRLHRKLEVAAVRRFLRTLIPVVRRDDV